MRITVTFSAREAAIIRSWYSFATDESMHYGGGTVVFPTEMMLLWKIDRSGEQEQSFTPAEIDLITDWMRKNVRGKYGSSTSLCGFEATLYQKIIGLHFSATD